MSPAKRTRRARGSLSREEILENAMAVVREKGLDQLSMPGLARQLGSGVTSIYWYFRSKEDLLVALAAQVTQELYSRLPPVTGKAWDEDLEAYWIAFRDEATRAPVYLELFSHVPRFLLRQADVAQSVIPRLEEELSVLVRAGLSVPEASEVYTALSVYTRGYVLLEHELSMEASLADSAKEVDRTIAGLDREAFPTLTAMPSFTRAMQMGDEHYRFGLRLMIDGVRSRFADLAG
jgi:AcrR family transcriptional regulator